VPIAPVRRHKSVQSRITESGNDHRKKKRKKRREGRRERDGRSISCRSFGINSIPREKCRAISRDGASQSPLDDPRGHGSRLRRESEVARDLCERMWSFCPSIDANRFIEARRVRRRREARAFYLARADLNKYMPIGCRWIER